MISRNSSISKCPGKIYCPRTCQFINVLKEYVFWNLLMYECPENCQICFFLKTSKNKLISLGMEDRKIMKKAL